jgi:winged helix DNA-binding protein
MVVAKLPLPPGPRESLVDRRFEDRVFRRAGWVSPVVLVDGVAAGVWSHELHDRRVHVTVKPFEGLGARRRNGIAEEADRLGAFLGLPAVVEFDR